MRGLFFLIAGASTALVLGAGYYYPQVLWAFVVVGPLVLLGLCDVWQRDHTLLRNFPVIGHMRYLFESISPEIQQYFIERHTDGTPFSRNQRSLVYARSKDERETHPFGTELDLYDSRYEGLAHSMYPSDVHEEPPRIRIGGPDCQRPYDASLLNISAMSFGALSRNAILALNEGAHLGGFYHNTGEGGLSPFHLAGGGDIVWQIGTGYFGCRTPEGRFDDAARHVALQLRFGQYALSQYNGLHREGRHRRRQDDRDQTVARGQTRPWRRAAGGEEHGGDRRDSWHRAPYDRVISSRASGVQ